MSSSAIGLKALIMTDNYASYNKLIFLKRVTQPMRQVNRLPLFLLPPPINTSSTTLVLLLVVSTQILCGNNISIKSPVNITVTWHVLDSKNRFYKALKLATKALKFIV